MNRVTLCGHLGGTPELRHTKGSEPMAVCNFTIATQEHRKSASGEREKYAEWHSVVCWGKLAENVAKFLNKGSQCLLEGSLVTRKWNKNGVDHYKTEIHATNVEFLNSKKEESHSAPLGDFASKAPFEEAKSDSNRFEDIPF